jgi:hypothetical protein
MTQYRLASSPMVHTPGLVAWGQNAYAFRKDRLNLMNVFTTAWPSVPEAAFDQLLSKRITHHVDGEVVIFDAYIPTDPTEISQEVFWEALECMPPSRFNRVGVVEMFHICELLIDDLASWYALYKGRYFTFNASCTTLAATIAERVKNA